MRKTIMLIATVIVICVGFNTIVCAKDDAIQCGNLIYGGTNTSKCFSDEFLSSVQRKTTIATERRFRSVKLSSEEVFNYPFVIMTGESEFFLTKKERVNLKHYLENGGFLLASAGCSSEAFDRAFRREMRSVFKKNKVFDLPKNHAIFRTLNKVEHLTLSKGGPEPRLSALQVNDKVVMIYSKEGLNDTAHASGCCCCGGNEISNSIALNENILIYALMH